MAGRPGKPAGLHIYNGNPGHKSTKELEFRKENEISLGVPFSEIKMPAQFKHISVARKKWKELQELYSGIEFVTSSDAGTVAELCLAYAELAELQSDLRKIQKVDFNPDEEIEINDEFEGQLGKRQAEKMWEKVEFIMSAAGALPFHKAIDAKRSFIVKAEDRLFLNPLAKVRNVPKAPTKEKPVDLLKQAGFDNV